MVRFRVSPNLLGNHMTFVNDPIGDLLTRIRNAQAVRKDSCSAPWSKIKLQLCELLVKEGWLQAVEVTGDAPKLSLKVTFVEGKMLELKRISRPGRRVYAPSSTLKPIQRGYGISILTTSVGLLTDASARKRKLGGEVLCTIS